MTSSSMKALLFLCILVSIVVGSDHRHDDNADHHEEVTTTTSVAPPPPPPPVLPTTSTTTMQPSVQSPTPIPTQAPEVVTPHTSTTNKPSSSSTPSPSQNSNQISVDTGKATDHLQTASVLSPTALLALAIAGSVVAVAAVAVGVYYVCFHRRGGNAVQHIASPDDDDKNSTVIEITPITPKKTLSRGKKERDQNRKVISPLATTTASGVVVSKMLPKGKGKHVHHPSTTTPSKLLKEQETEVTTHTAAAEEEEEERGGAFVDCLPGIVISEEPIPSSLVVPRCIEGMRLGY